MIKSTQHGVADIKRVKLLQEDYSLLTLLDYCVRVCIKLEMRVTQSLVSINRLYIH